MEPKRQFKGVWIPAEIMDDRSLSATEKMLLAEIFSLTGEDGCFASNEYLAEKIGISTSWAANTISKLRSRGYIIDVNFDGRKRYIKVCWDTVKIDAAFPDKDAENNNPALLKTITLPYCKQEGSLIESNNIDISIDNSIDLLSKDNKGENEFSHPVEEKKSILKEIQKTKKSTGPAAVLDVSKFRWPDLALEWIEYRRERKPAIKTQKQLEAWMVLLIEYSGGRLEVAKKIVQKAMGNNWQGIQPLRENEIPKERKSQMTEWYGEQ